MTTIGNSGIGLASPVTVPDILAELAPETLLTKKPGL